MKTMIAAVVFSLLGWSLAEAIGSGAAAGPIDMRTLTPQYQDADGNWLIGVAPGYSQSVTSTSLTITGQPFQSNTVFTHNFTNFPLLDGDFTASVSVDLTPGAGGFFNPSKPTNYFGVGFLYGEGVHGNYGTSFGNVNTPNIPSSSNHMDFTLARSGDTFTAYASFGGPYVNVYSLTGPSIPGQILIDIGAFGATGVDVPETTTFHNLVAINSVTSELVGLTGGTPDNPIPLPATPVSSISGGIGDGFPDSDFYSFYWKGGALAVSVGVPDAANLTSPPSYLFDLCDGTTCNDILQQIVADESNDWAGELGGDLAAGYYTVGIIEQSSANDPNFFFRFETPLSQIAIVPEPSIWGMMLIGFAGLGYAGYRRARGSRAAA
jgi:hypothetical protein